jgi:hypothetical protein
MRDWRLIHLLENRSTCVAIHQELFAGDRLREISPRKRIRGAPSRTASHRALAGYALKRAVHFHGVELRRVIRIPTEDE